MNQLSCVVLFVAASTASFADCPVTSAAVFAVDLPAPKGWAWHGSDALAVLLPADGVWKGMGRSHNYGDKFWMWRRGYDPRSEGTPDVVIEGVRLENPDSAQRFHLQGATNAFGQNWSRMLAGLTFPSVGCWQVTVTYRHLGITHDQTFVLQVVDEARL
jgi:hypothetical protein